MTAPVPATVIVPTVGRPALADAVGSIARCDPPPAQLLVVDQSESDAVATALAAAGVTATVVPMRRAGIAAAMNRGLRAAAHDHVLVTHDDCRVAPDWVGVGTSLLAVEPEALWTGRVLPDVRPGQDPARVPSTIADAVPRRYEGAPFAGVLYPANMVVSRDAALALGGFDERFVLAAEDNDFCLRWTDAGAAVCFEPRLTVWHGDWRSPEELTAVYRQYQLAQGQLLAKYLRLRHPQARRLVTDTVRWVAAGTVRRLAGRRGPDETAAAMTHIPYGILRTWRQMRPVRDRWVQ